ncbi:putative signal transducing protein [Pedobacter sp. MW01-1-1]|uniref:putative signal transducing protein n=1 Tax=Pedobacter sp. MW01-1-1 TaxID=3383027 RepID=UPI003FEEE7A2
MNENWIKVYTTSNAFAAEVLKQGLTEAGIPAVTLNKQIAAYYLGEINVLVNKTDFDKAIEYIVANDIE